MQQNTSIALLISLTFLVLQGTKCKEATQNVPIKTIRSGIVDSARAALNYRIECGGCHGQKMQSFIERNWEYGNSPEEVCTSIDKGYAANGMPAYENALTADERIDLTNYILQAIEGKTKSDIQNDNPRFSGLISSDDLAFRIETLDTIAGIPWAVEQLPNGSFLVTERSGRLYLKEEGAEKIEISGLPAIAVISQGGLLDVALHPDFETNQFIYLSYSYANPASTNENTTAVARAKLVGNTLQDLELIFKAEPYVASGLHFGSRLQFDAGGFLYFSVGDRGMRDVFPQRLDNGFGKVHRIRDDGSIPMDNPFFGNDTAHTSVFAYGIRNPQGLALHPETGAIWEGEHGPRGGDEINILEPGNNYGWPVISYGINYDGSTFTDITEKEGMEQPIHYWDPSIAPCGMTFSASEYYGSWKNDLFVSSLKFEYLHRLKMDGNNVVGHEELLDGIGRVRDVHQGRDGYLYILVEEPGRLIRLVPEQ